MHCPPVIATLVDMNGQRTFQIKLTDSQVSSFKETLALLANVALAPVVHDTMIRTIDMRITQGKSSDREAIEFASELLVQLKALDRKGTELGMAMPEEVLLVRKRLNTDGIRQALQEALSARGLSLNDKAID